ncbi:MAG TPA: HEAT repeat domain-containing protein [Chthonomonadaceae bacterium]|nr:HEAT repeat domain-containing protein [Chthonomonadaceae bacterium]
MRFWDRARKREPETAADVWKQLGQAAAQAHLAGEDPRQSEAVGMWIGLLWRCRRPEEAGGDFWTIPLEPKKGDAPYYIGFARILREQAPELPSEPEGRYALMVAALRRALLVDREEMLYGAELFPIANQEAAVGMVQRLQAVELHDVCCELVMDVGDLLNRHLDDSRRVALEDLNSALGRCLASLPPDQIPRFWEILKHKSARHSVPISQTRALSRVDYAVETLWPIAGQMRDKRAVPFLLEALPILPEDGQVSVITALAEIGDSRAIPALQALTVDETRQISVIARRAVEKVLRHSRDDAAQLLRPSDRQHVGNQGQTLLRPAEGASAAVRPEELLRPAGLAEPEKRD